jgi:hypothetical protein
MTDFNNFPKHIVVFTNGFVYVGNHDRDGQRIYNCQNLRNWGTTRGIGQLAIEGPTGETALDDCGILEYYTTPIVMFPVVHDLFTYVGPTYDDFGEQSIVIAERSFVFAGVMSDLDEKGLFTVSKAHVIRKFGTESKGLGYLALAGAQPETVLDDCGMCTLPKESVLFRIPCVRDLV